MAGWAPELANFKMPATGAGLAATTIASLFMGATMLWLRLDRTPPSWDDGYYLTKSLELYDTLAERGVAGYAMRFLTAMDTKPPLITALPTPIYLAVGRGYRAAYAVNLVFLGVMFAAVYGIAKRYAGPRAGLIAVSALGSIPVLYGLSHWYLVECGLIAIVCAAVYLMTGWSESSRSGRASVLGATCGFGLLMKASFPVYVLVPFVYFIVRWRKTALQRKSMAAFFAAALLVAAPWYLVNFRGMISTALNAGSAETAKVYETGEAFSLSAAARYFSDLTNAAPGLYLAALPLFALAAASLGAPAKKGLLLAVMWLSPVVFLAAGHYRDIRFASPLYPAVALMLAFLADAAIRRRRAIATAAVCAMLSVGLWSMVQNSFGVFGSRLELGGLLLVAPRLSYARAYSRMAWPQREILADLYRLSKFSGGERRPVLLGTNSVRFNADNFTLAAVAGKLPFEIGTTAYITGTDAAAQAVNRAPYFVYKEGGERDQPSFNTFGDAAAKQVRDSGRFTELPISRALPDGGVARVFARIALNP